MRAYRIGAAQDGGRAERLAWSHLDVMLLSHKRALLQLGHAPEQFRAPDAGGASSNAISESSSRYLANVTRFETRSTQFPISERALAPLEWLSRLRGTRNWFGPIGTWGNGSSLAQSLADRFVAYSDIGRDLPQGATLVGEHSDELDAIAIELAATRHVVSRACRAPTVPPLGRRSDHDGIVAMTR